ncbi:alpha/beta hydrolase family esterase [Muricoccus aerilatus]|uniref:extracellular catalytic domain type 1 short-chain-length polyhydroxyalkanoate depolymerase n=1 Tax=Muricoccus aerilatus TaxID=452982 RepID=UPI0006933993|nr:PHB depolymerase family esterase [Roseomonas aerilata]
MPNPKIDLSALVRLQRRRREAVARAGGTGGGSALTEVTGFGSNPGALRMMVHVPADLPRGAPLVVALHGCTQNAAAYDEGCGWSSLADRLGFAVLLPEQQRTNNHSLCFNWFEPGDIARGTGEALSIRQMVAQMLETHAIDPARVFVTGLSAGGAMTAVMLATYPEVFAGGAIIAGLPYGAGLGVAEALRAMSRPPSLGAAERGAAVRAASPHRGAWPRVSVWHGGADTTVVPNNAEESVKQWLDLHGLAAARPVTEAAAPGDTHLTWRGPGGRVMVESHRIAGMAHGVPLRPGEGGDRAGAAGAYMLDVGISSSHAILGFWGIDTAAAARPQPAQSHPLEEPAFRPEAAAASPAGAPAEQPYPSRAKVFPPAPIQARRPTPSQGPVTRMSGQAEADPLLSGPGATIVRALRAAGLMGTGRD